MNWLTVRIKSFFSAALLVGITLSVLATDEQQLVRRIRSDARLFSEQLGHDIAPFRQQGAVQEFSDVQSLFREIAGQLEWCQRKLADQIYDIARVYLRDLQNGLHLIPQTRETLLNNLWDCRRMAPRIEWRLREIETMFRSAIRAERLTGGLPSIRKDVLFQARQALRQAIDTVRQIGDWSEDQWSSLHEIVLRWRYEQLLPFIGQVVDVPTAAEPEEDDPFWESVALQRPIEFDFLKELFRLVPGESRFPALARHDLGVCPVCQINFSRSDALLFKL